MPVAPLRAFFAALSLLSLMIFGAVADDAYPDRPITMVVTFAAGGSSDLLARAVGAALSAGLGQQVVVDNRPGAGGHIGAEAVAHAAPDGYTILFGTNGTLGIGPALYKDLRYDPEHDLAPVGLLHKLPLLLIVNPSVPAKTLAELIDYARHNPGKLTFASAGIGSASHLAGELLKEAANIDILHVPYKGGGAAVTDLVSGRVSMMIETIPNALPWCAAARCGPSASPPKSAPLWRRTFRVSPSRGCRISTSAPGLDCSYRPARRPPSSIA
jgi:tripartite-type tricarboxylate transporter receptor subunit TctC